MLTTIEGVFERIISNLESDIELKKELDKELTDKLQAFVVKLKDLKSLKEGPFEIVRVAAWFTLSGALLEKIMFVLKIVDDPSGDSFIENPSAPNKDPNLVISYYKRNKEQSEFIGLTV